MAYSGVRRGWGRSTEFRQGCISRVCAIGPWIASFSACRICAADRIGKAPWLAESDEQRAGREKSNFLRYVDSQGRYAEFHSNRHTFITNLSLSGVCPRDAQELARHSDVRLTINVYTHVGLDDKAKAIGKLGVPGRAARALGVLWHQRLHVFKQIFESGRWALVPQRIAQIKTAAGVRVREKQIDHLAYMKERIRIDRLLRLLSGCGLLKQLRISVSRRWIAPIRSCFNENAKWSIYFFADP